MSGGSLRAGLEVFSCRYDRVGFVLAPAAPVRAAADVGVLVGAVPVLAGAVLVVVLRAVAALEFFSCRYDRVGFALAPAALVRAAADVGVLVGVVPVLAGAVLVVVLRAVAALEFFSCRYDRVGFALAPAALVRAAADVVVLVGVVLAGAVVVVMCEWPLLQLASGGRRAIGQAFVRGRLLRHKGTKDSPRMQMQHWRSTKQQVTAKDPKMIHIALNNNRIHCRQCHGRWHNGPPADRTNDKDGRGPVR
jgi:hypothetical protein